MTQKPNIPNRIMPNQRIRTFGWGDLSMNFPDSFNYSYQIGNDRVVDKYKIDPVVDLVSESAKTLKNLSDIKALRQENINKLYDALNKISDINAGKEQVILEQKEEISKLKESHNNTTIELGRVNSKLLTLANIIKDIANRNSQNGINNMLDQTKTIVNNNREEH